MKPKTRPHLTNAFIGLLFLIPGLMFHIYYHLANFEEIAKFYHTATFKESVAGTSHLGIRLWAMAMVGAIPFLMMIVPLNLVSMVVLVHAPILRNMSGKATLMAASIIGGVTAMFVIMKYGNPILGINPTTSALELQYMCGMAASIGISPLLCHLLNSLPLSWSPSPSDKEVA